MAWNMGKGIWRATLAALFVGCGVGFAQGAQECSEPMWLTLSLIDHAAIAGAPEIGRAAAALRAGQREEAIALLDKANGEVTVATVVAVVQQKGGPYTDAAINAGLASWKLRGCPAQ